MGSFRIPYPNEVLGPLSYEIADALITLVTSEIFLLFVWPMLCWIALCFLGYAVVSIFLFGTQYLTAENRRNTAEIDKLLDDYERNYRAAIEQKNIKVIGEVQDEVRRREASRKSI